MHDVFFCCAAILAVSAYAAIRFEVYERKTRNDLARLNHLMAKHESTLHVLSLSAAAIADELSTIRGQLVEIETQTKSWEVVQEPVFVARACDPKSK